MTTAAPVQQPGCRPRPLAAVRPEPFTDVPVAPLAAGLVAHAAWLRTEHPREPFADWGRTA